MKKLLILPMLILSVSIFAQSGINYQTVVRDSDGILLSNQSVTLTFEIREGTISGTAIYTETHTENTNSLGLVTLVIGAGTVVTGIFDTIPWGDDDYFLNVDLDGTDMGTTQFVNVPYAYFADESGISDYADEAGISDYADEAGISDYADEASIADSALSLTNLKVNTAVADFELTSDDDYALLHIRPTTNYANDSSGIFFGEGTNPDLGMGFLYDGLSDILSLYGNNGNIQGPHLTVTRNSGKVTITKGVEISETTSAPAPRTVYGNTGPLAYGYFSGTTIGQDYGITSVTNTTTGVFIITLDNDFTGAPVVLATAYNSLNDTETAVYSYSPPNTITVRFVNESNTAINTNFSVLVFGTPAP